MTSYKKHVWDQACQLTVIRGSKNGMYEYHPEPLDPGVNFFILALEELGAKTQFSCEGHPKGFYIAFEAPYSLVLELVTIRSNMSIEVWKENFWTLRNIYAENPTIGEYVDNDRKEKLRHVTKSWLDYFGPRLAKTLKQIAVGQVINCVDQAII